MSYFITGTDTGVGKTLVSCALLQSFAAQGKRVAGFKPVAAGCDEDGHNEDAVRLHAASAVPLGYEQVNPYCLREAIAPHIAAKNECVRIELPRILVAYRELAGQADEVIVEGAGGFMVPLNDTQTTADLAKLLGIPIILVVSMRLGCLNHALLTAEAIASRGLTLAGWVANILNVDGTTRRCEASGAGVPSDRLLPQTPDYAGNVSKADMRSLHGNIEALSERITAPLLGVVPYMAQPDVKAAAGKLDLKMLGKRD
jgi:dethiobiotin synthetase